MKQIIQTPKSKFMRVACKKCKNEQFIYNKLASVAKCLKCGEVLAEPTGGEAFVKGKIIESLM